ncbi:chemotaxis protein CheW [Geomonas paludis]|uniref:Chemotaxis protein CheW n=2 Tax=Geomonas TaxID=2651583 RepID=A0A6V8MZ04_9BACT|nr:MULTISPECIES: chemotaxis protein CheW [Geomonas]MBJ6751647.1 chemotaxis protein CheW [Geomonas anaerohicana]UPU37019.1 chemotaxis protein CheW [Geomonas paludis]GFO64887.1 chemotaxis protein CheW [Geomonas paludis]
MQTAQGSAVEQLTADGGAEYLTFTLGSESYGIDILKVQEIRGYDCVTRIANTPAFIKGVINLRGVIVPIVDLRIKFNVGEATYHEFTVVIIINVLNKVVGIVVDGVSDVVALPAQSIKPAPELGASLDTRYITGLGTLNDEMLILVDIEKLIGSDELQIVDSTVDNTQKEAVNL